MKSKYALAGAVIFCVLAVLVIYWLHNPNPVFVTGAPLPPVVPSCSPPKQSNDNSNTAHTVCQTCGSQYNKSVGETSTTDPNWECCPDGYTPFTDNRNRKMCKKQ